MDQVQLHSLADLDDGRDLSGYDFHSHSLSELAEPDRQRLLAYRYRAMQSRYDAGEAVPIIPAPSLSPFYMTPC